MSVFGETAKQALYHQIGSKFRLTHAELQSRPLDTAEYLHRILGDAGYSFIEKLIVREIRISFGITMRNGISLSEAVTEARKNFLSRE